MTKRQNIVTLKKKIKKVWRDWLFKYEQKYYWKNRRDKADYLAQKYPKLVVFKDHDIVRCLSCPKMMKREDCNGCHWIEKSSNWQYRCRRQERNIYPCCEECNARQKERHHTALTVHVTRLYWLERVEEKLAESYKTHKKPTREEIDATIAHYTELIKNLEEPVDNSDFIDWLLAEIK